MVIRDIHYWLALKFVPRLSVSKKITLVKQFGLRALFDSSVPLSTLALSQKQITALRQPDWQRIEAILNAANHCGCYVYGYDDALYPPQLKQIFDPPLIIYVKGNPDILSQQQLAIVGSRSASISAKEITKSFAQQLWQQGVIVTSGLAIGIDGCAHKAVVDVKGQTIAVVATGLDSVYPSRHKQLAKDIIANGGAILSEFPPGTLAKPGHFPKRNRIISGLSKGVLVVEAQLKSGSLITARTAIEQNREVFAVPGNIANPLAQGCHYLIKQGAKLVENISDITEELDFSLTKDDENLRIKKVNNNVKQSLSIDPLLASVGDEITPIDVIVSRSKLPIEEALKRLTVLELKGQVLMVPGGYQKIMKG